MKKFLATTAITLCLSGAFYMAECFAQEKQNNLINNEITPDTYRNLRKVILEGSPDELKEMIRNGLNVNGMYRCEIPLNMAISSLAYALGSATGFPPENAVEKVKILIESGADANFEPCTPASVPLVTAIQLPFNMYSLEESFYRAIDEEIKSDKGTENCLAGAIPKPCKELTQEDRKAIRESIHETYEIARKNLVPYMMNIIRFLVDNGANINATDAKNRTPLHRAASIPQTITLEPLSFLIEKKANVNVPDIEGNTPIFIAYSYDNTSAVKLLIDAGADVTMKNHNGLLYNQLTGSVKRIYLDKEGTIKQDDNFGVKHNL